MMAQGGQTRNRGSALLFTFLSLVSLEGARGQEGELRALWVTRWDYRTPADVRAIVRNAAQHNFNTLLFQVRGNGTVCYRSNIEPWAEEFAGQDPGWDPLQTAIDEAHAAGIALHAWVNVYPGWRGTTPPANPDQLWNRHRDWFMTDPDGRLQRLNPHYVWLSPTNPEVQAYLQHLFLELLERYQVDGIHLDYFRFPGPGFSFDPRSLMHFRLHNNGQSPADAPEVWDEWRRSAITRLLTVLYSAVKSRWPHVVVSSAVVGDLHNGKRLFFQDSHRWLAMGIVDVIFPMLYTTDTTLFRRLAAEHLSDAKGRLVCPGIEATVLWSDQVRIARELGAKGFALFSYQALFPGHNVSPRALQELLTAQPERVSAPTLTWKVAEEDLQGPLVSALSTLPTVVREGESCKVTCTISDENGVYDDQTGSDGQGVYLVWTIPERSDTLHELTMSPLPSHPGWFISDAEIPGQKAGTELHLRVFARDNSKNHNLGYSPLASVVVDFAQPLFTCEGEFGPLVWNATAIGVDSSGQIWVTSYEDRCVHVLNPDGSETSFSPIRTGLSPTGEPTPITRPTTVAVNSRGEIHVGCGTSPGFILRFDHTGQAFLGIEFSFAVSSLDFDRFDRAYVLESGRAIWHVYDPVWGELQHSPFGESGTGNSLAASPDGAKVYVASESDGLVQCWERVFTAAGIYFEKRTPLSPRNVGKGGVHTDSNGTIFVSHMPAGRVTVLDGEGKVLGLLRGGSPPLRAPKNVALCSSGNVVYVLETGAAGPSRLSKWARRTREPAQR